MSALRDAQTRNKLGAPAQSLGAGSGRAEVRGFTFTMSCRVIFIHQNLPGQFKHLLRFCTGNPAFEVVVIGEKRRVLANFPRAPSGVKRHVYEMIDIPPISKMSGLK